MVEVWDMVSGNVAAVYDTETDARVALADFLKKHPDERGEHFAIVVNEEHTHTEEQLRKATDALSGVSETHRTTEGK